MKRRLLSTILVIVILVALAIILTITTFGATNPIIRNEEQPGRYYGNGPFSYKSYQMPSSSVQGTGGATVYYPTSGTPPYSGIVHCPPYLGTQSDLAAWGPFFASHGIILVTFDTRTTGDQVDQRDDQQRTVLNALKNENTRSGSPLQGKVETDRIGAMGWSMGGGATWINSGNYDGLKTAMTLAGHNLTASDRSATGVNTKCPILIMNGATDTSYLGGMGQSSGVYSKIPAGIPKIIYEVSNAGHFDWNSPTAASRDVAIIALAFQKTFLDGDTRWVEFIQKPSSNVATWGTANLPAAITVPTATIQIATPTAGTKCGDVNSSGSVDIADALIIAQYYVGTNPHNFDQSVADVNGDGNINVQDALLTAQYYVGIIDTLLCN